MLKGLSRFLDPRQKILSRQVVSLFKFTSAADVSAWSVKTDSEYIGGGSRARAEFIASGNYARFSGSLSTELPKGDQKIVRSGFCLFRSPEPGETKWRGQKFLDLGMNNALEVQLRGDGRAYIINIQTSSLHSEDLYQAAIYTRGGPHWQTIHIPVSEFLLTYMGYVQNEQPLLSTERVRTIGFLLADRINGPFQLDIRSIKAITMKKELVNMDASPVADGDQDQTREARKMGEEHLR